jgi:hypothetical protein
METLQQIIDILKKCPIHKSIDKNDEIMYCDLDYKMICYSIENMRLFEVKTKVYPAVQHNGKYRESFHKTLAQMRLKGDNIGSEFEVVYQKSDIELAEILIELQQNECEKHVL